MKIIKWPRPAVLVLICLVVYISTMVYVLFNPNVDVLRVDEVVHVPTIENFLHGRFSPHPWLTTIPGYHFLMACILKLLGLDSVASMRMVSAVLALMPATLFYAIRRELCDDEALLHAAMLMFLPFLFPYGFLVYTDVLSLTLVLGATLASLRQRHVIASLILIASILVRQNNVVWAGFLPLLVLWPLIKAGDWRGWRQWMMTCLPYGMPLVVFVVFWMWNGSISLSRTVEGLHPDATFHLGDIFFSLFLYVVFFPYSFCINLVRFFVFARRRPWLWLIPVLAIVFVRLNGSSDNQSFTHYFLHNWVIEFVHHGVARRVFGLVIALAFLSMARSRFVLQQGWLIYPFAAFYLASSWLIEGRYAIVPFALWMALRKSESEVADRLTLAIWGAVSLFFVCGIFSGRLML